MNTAEGILVIIVSVTLSVFLIVAILILVQVLKLVRTMREIARKAEKVVSSAESVGSIFRKASGPVGVVNLLRTILESVAEHKHKGE